MLKSDSFTQIKSNAILKLTIAVLFFLSIPVQLYSQDQKITFSNKQAKISTLFEEIEAQTGMTIAYNAAVIDVNKTLSVDVSNKTLTEALTEILKNTNTTFSIQGKQIIISQSGNQSKKKITGVITDVSGEPVIGATVKIKGTNTATITDVDGKYTIEVSSNSVLQVSYVGFTTTDIPVGNKSQADLVLEEDTQALDEVVVVGYGVQKKRDLTGAVSSVKMSDAPVGTFSSASHALAGKAAGLRVTQATAQPGAGTTFRIRGETSINASNAPLIIVDGFPISSSASPSSGNNYTAGSQDNVMEMINPNDIESIEVLKDASATAIYGSRAGHGVIIVTTKRGKAGIPNVTYSGNLAVQTISSKYKMLDAQGYMNLSNMYELEKWRRNTGTGVYSDYVTPSSTAAYTPKYTDQEIADAKTTDWMDEITRTGIQTSHNISISGGTEKSKYLASLNYFDQKGVLKNSDMQRITANLNSDYDLSKYVKAGLSFNISRNKYGNVPLGTGGNEYSGIIAAATFFEPNIPVYDENGDFSESNVYKQRPNPVSMLDIEDKTTKDRVLGTGFISVEPIKGLIIKANLGFDRKVAKRQTYLPTTTLYGKTENGKAYQNQIDGMDYLFNLTANYMKTLGKHSFTVLAGYEWQEFNTEWFSAGNTDFPLDSFIYNNLNAGSGEKTVGSNSTKNSLGSIFGRFNYSYANKYLITATLRADASSNFNKDNRWGYFPSVSAGWRFIDEDFMKDQHILTNGKLRAGYGQTGNTSVGNRTQSNYKSDNKYVFGSTGTNGMVITSLGNSDITWETTSEWNVGLELGFLDNRINLTGEYYNREISDLLVTAKRLPSYNELTTITANAGSTQSKGIEITLNTVNVKTQDLLWTSDLTFYKYKDTWKKRDPNWIPAAYQSEKDPIRAIFTYKSDGLLQPVEEAPAWQKGLLPGQIKLKKMNADGDQTTLENSDRVYLGTTDPDFSFGFNNTVRYKNFDFNIYLYGEIGRWRDASYYDGWLPYRYFAPSGGLYNMSQKALDSWTMDNQNSSTPSLLTSSYSAGDYFYKKVSYIRCRNITIGYTIPGLKNVARSIRVNVSVNNPFVISNWNGLDPETDYNPSDSNTENAWSYSYPNVRTFSFGVDISF